jgi:hypothetical protein
MAVSCTAVPTSLKRKNSFPWSQYLFDTVITNTANVLALSHSQQQRYKNIIIIFFNLHASLLAETF